MKRISIIIPVHNVEKYLEKCLNSIISQINEQDEIILINDNSQDSSEQICKKFVEQYNNIKLENGIYRSEEHTSELQSRGLISYDVVCLKKKKNSGVQNN